MIANSREKIEENFAHFQRFFCQQLQGVWRQNLDELFSSERLFSSSNFSLLPLIAIRITFSSSLQSEQQHHHLREINSPVTTAAQHSSEDKQTLCLVSGKTQKRIVNENSTTNVRFEFAPMWRRRRKCCIIKSPPFDVTKIWGDKGGRKRQREDANGTETTQEVKSDEIKFKRKEKNVKIDCRNVQVVRGGFSVFFRMNLYDDDADISFFGSGMDKTKKNHLIKTKKKVYTFCWTEISCFF